MLGDGRSQSVDLAGGWLVLQFRHDLFVAHALKNVGGERLRIGVWRVPATAVLDLEHALRGREFAWSPAASSYLEAARAREEQLAREDDAALLAKSGVFQVGTVQLRVPLLPHQRVAAAFLCHRTGALLCDEQGLGKTLSALAAFDRLRAQRVVSQLVVVCPNSLKFTWEREIGTFFPEWRVSVARGAKRKRQRAYAVTADVYVLNYEALRSDYADVRLLLRAKPTVLICDESHAAKNPDSHTTWALMFVRGAAARIWAMSGTPIANRLKDCYSQVTIVDGGRTFGSKGEFWRRYVQDVEAERWSEVMADVQRRLEPILLRRTKEEVLDLPDKTFEARYVELAGQQWELYEQMRRDMYCRVEAMSDREFEASAPSVLAQLLRLAQLASNPRLVVPAYKGVPAKFREIDQLLEELIEANGRKVVLWSYYVKTIQELLGRYRRYNPVAIFGQVPIEERSRAVEAFQNDGGVMLFVGNPQAAGSGLTLTAAHYAIYESLTWRYDLYAQSLDRVHRIGQSRNVTYIKVLAYGTIDLAIDANLGRKQEAAAELLGDRARMPIFRRLEVLSMLEPLQSGSSRRQWSGASSRAQGGAHALQSRRDLHFERASESGSK